MSIVRAKTNQYGPATIDIQIEQAADFILPIQVLVAGVVAPISGWEISAWFSPQWSPGQQQIALTITPTDLDNGRFDVVFPAASSAALALPFPPRKSVVPDKFTLGGWVLHLDDGVDVTRYAEGSVTLDRAPWLT